MQRIEVRGLGDLALRDGQQRVEEPERDARQARQARGHLEQVRHRVAQDEERALGCVLRERFADKPRARAVVGKHRLEVALKDERSVPLGEEESARLDDATQRLAHDRRVLAKVLGDDRRPARWARVVAGVREAREPLEQDLELEEVLDLSLDRKARQPGFARLGLLAPQAARIAQEVVIGVPLFARAIESGDDHGRDCTSPRVRSRTKRVERCRDGGSRDGAPRDKAATRSATSKKCVREDDTWIGLARTEARTPARSRRKKPQGRRSSARSEETRNL